MNNWKTFGKKLLGGGKGAASNELNFPIKEATVVTDTNTVGLNPLNPSESLPPPPEIYSPEPTPTKLVLPTLPSGENTMSEAQIIELLNNNEIFKSRLASTISNNSIFIQTLVGLIVPEVVNIFQERYDLTPTDKLKQSIMELSTESDRINKALEEKGKKLSIVENKIAEALNNIAPQVTKMLSDVAHSVLHDAGTQAGNQTNNFIKE